MSSPIECNFHILVGGYIEMFFIQTKPERDIFSFYKFSNSEKRNARQRKTQKAASWNKNKLAKLFKLACQSQCQWIRLHMVLDTFNILYLLASGLKVKFGIFGARWECLIVCVCLFGNASWCFRLTTNVHIKILQIRHTSHFTYLRKLLRRKLNKRQIEMIWSTGVGGGGEWKHCKTARN